jgi:predicted Zn-dependent protease
MSNICYCGTPAFDLAAGAPARWSKSQLLWSVQTDLPGVLHDAFRAAIAEALAAWAAVCGMTFAEAPSAAQADILIATGPIDGPQGILAYSELPPASPVHQKYDTGEQWRTAAGQGIDLPTVACHELGHALGLDHDAQGSGSLMAPYYDPNVSKPQPRDIARAVALYGPPRQTPPSPPAPPPVTPAEKLVIALFPDLKQAELPAGWSQRKAA